MDKFVCLKKSEIIIPEEEDSSSEDDEDSEDSENSEGGNSEVELEEGIGVEMVADAEGMAVTFNEEKIDGCELVEGIENSVELNGEDEVSN